jgi:Domain of unknown function (DUF4375)
MDLRVPYRTYHEAKDEVARVTALFARLEPVMFDAETPEEIEAALGNLTAGQRALWAVEQLQMETGNGGLEQYFFNSAGGTAREALDGLRLFGLKKLEKLFAKAVAMFPDGAAPRDRDERMDLLEDEAPADRLDALTERWEDAYEGAESLSKAALAYVDAHPAEFFLDAA